MGSNESFSFQTETITKHHRKPNRLLPSFTRFDVLEKKRIEEERAKIREKRKALLEEERKLFEKARKHQKEDIDDVEKVSLLFYYLMRVRKYCFQNILLMDPYNSMRKIYHLSSSPRETALRKRFQKKRGRKGGRKV